MKIDEDPIPAAQTDPEVREFMETWEELHLKLLLLQKGRAAIALLRV